MATETTQRRRQACPARSWYTITNRGSDEAEIKIYEDIGIWGVTAKRFADELEEVEAKEVHVRLNTNGGDTFDGIAIYNALRAHPAKVIVHVDGLAASAGSIIAMSGDEIRMADNAFLMIHENQAGVFGEADDLRQWADVLDKLNDSVASTYQERAGKTRKYWREKMAVESWFSAEEAKDEGLCDCVDDRESAAQNRRFDFQIYNHAHDVPERVQREWGKQTNNQAPEPSPRGDASPAVSTQEPAMATDTQADTAQDSGAVATPTNPPPVAAKKPIDAAEEHAREMEKFRGMKAEAVFANGRSKGREEGAKAERDRLEAILAVCPGKPDMAIGAFMSGQTPDAVKLAYDEAAKVETAAKAREQALEREKARWEALAHSGGYPGGVGLDLAGDDEEEESDAGGKRLDKAAATKQAEAEWNHTPRVRKGFTSKDNYVAFRAAQLTGRLAAPAKA